MHPRLEGWVVYRIRRGVVSTRLQPWWGDLLILELYPIGSTVQGQIHVWPLGIWLHHSSKD